MKLGKIIAICLLSVIVLAGCSKIPFLNKNKTAPANQGKTLDQDQTITSPASKTGLPLFTRRVPAGWKVTKLSADNEAGTGREIEIAKGDYKLKIAEPQEGSICVLPGQPEFQGPASSFDQIEEVILPTGPIVMGRSVLSSSDAKVFFIGCSPEKGQTAGTVVYLGTGTSVGSIVYTVPVSYDNLVIKEMDTILQSIALVK